MKQQQLNSQQTVQQTENPYFRSPHARNVFQDGSDWLLMGIARSFQLIVETFIRTDLGEQRFSINVATFMIGVLIYLHHYCERFFDWTIDLTFYPFLIVYVIMTVITYVKIKKRSAVMSPTRYSKSPGYSFDFFFKLRIFGKKPSQKVVDIYLEPLLFILPGLLLVLVQQFFTGFVLILAGLGHFLANRQDALAGYHFVLDTWDRIIVNEDLAELFVQTDEDISQRGVPLHYLTRPNTRELRQQLVDAIVPKDHDAVAVY